VLLATKESHALGDILIRYMDGDLGADIECVIANHDTLRDLVERFDIPFHHIPAEDMSREDHEAKVMQQIDQYEFDYIVLAKYMRILTPDFVKAYPQKIINIHHSFLPAFIGANPYKQAYERGVKIIGATAHFVTDDLDEGPIIAQDVIPVNHRFSWKDMQRAGRDGEKIVLSRALSLVLQDRVFVNGNKTVIF
jgi:formyltetrahydrofolate deformylase